MELLASGFSRFGCAERSDGGSSSEHFAHGVPISSSLTIACGASYGFTHYGLPGVCSATQGSRKITSFCSSSALLKYSILPQEQGETTEKIVSACAKCCPPAAEPQIPDWSWLRGRNMAKHHEGSCPEGTWQLRNNKFSKLYIKANVTFNN